ncbi:FAD:protein FMN transferase [Neobacillus mesonae]|uniref:FAD:protein FMN transferase n=1 Tax=Neobacillus mesonae TaxID=1193713 RepID=UPI00203C8043|nr:FAD:protein FMN transferase [Neobacillus mesonae]MCM3571331.1 FAD:protein FMN transferase [Neobacillus mesonae]
MIAKQEDRNSPETVRIDAMNTSFFIVAYDCKIKNWKQIIVDWIFYVEEEWSRFKQGNELSKVNQLEDGKEAPVSPPLFDLLIRAEEYRKKTNGFFSPYLLPQMEFHGYNRSFPFQTSEEMDVKIPPVYSIEKCPFSLNMHTQKVKRLTEGQLDLGGIAKGYVVQAAANWLKEQGRSPAGMVDGGGDISVWSKNDKEWRISIAHPIQTELDIGMFRIKNGAIATSNILYRSWYQGQQEKHHLLNGKTGEPVKTNIIQATAITESCVDAEVMAKLCFMAGGQELDKLLNTIHPNYSYILVTKEEK